jgi:hypothetical protein
MSESNKANAAYERDSIIDTLTPGQFDLIINNIDSVGAYKYISGFDGYGIWGYIEVNRTVLFFGQDCYKYCSFSNGKSNLTLYLNSKAEKIINKTIQGNRNKYLRKNHLKPL